jgi:hypothetical protein
MAPLPDRYSAIKGNQISPDLEERLLVCWLNAQEFPSALLCNRVQDLRSGVILHELASNVLVGTDPASKTALSPRSSRSLCLLICCLRDPINFKVYFESAAQAHLCANAVKTANLLFCRVFLHSCYKTSIISRPILFNKRMHFTRSILAATAAPWPAVRTP